MPEETIWEVWARVDLDCDWYLVGSFSSYKEAKHHYEFRLRTLSLMCCIVRAELHRTIVLEDLRGNVYAD